MGDQGYSDTQVPLLSRCEQERRKCVDEAKAEAKARAIKKQKLIIVTDIGSDADDAIALLTLFALPDLEFDLLGIVCCFGEVFIRQKLCKELLKVIADRLPTEVPVLAGSVAPLGACTTWHGGWEGQGYLPPDEIEKLRIGAENELRNLPRVLEEYHGNAHPSLKETSAAAHQQTASARTASARARGMDPFDDGAGARFISEQVAKYPKEVAIAVLGAATDLALAMRHDPTLASNVQRIAFMGLGLPRELLSPGAVLPVGEEYRVGSSQNVRCDVVAAHEVMSSSAEVHVITGTLTRGLIGPVRKDLEAILKSASRSDSNSLQSAFALASQNVQDWCFAARDLYWHDPVTVIEAIQPGYLLRYKRGHFFVHLENGESTFVFDPQHGPHYAAIGMEQFSHNGARSSTSSCPEVDAFHIWIHDKLAVAAGGRSQDSRLWLWLGLLFLLVSFLVLWYVIATFTGHGIGQKSTALTALPRSLASSTHVLFAPDAE